MKRKRERNVKATTCMISISIIPPLYSVDDNNGVAVCCCDGGDTGAENHEIDIEASQVRHFEICYNTEQEFQIVLGLAT
jgi:hypothetical protein